MRQAAILTPDQTKAAIAAATAEGPMERVIVLLSLTAALRAAEIAGLTWSNVTDNEGRLASSLAVPAYIGKGHKGRTVPMSSILAEALTEWRKISRWTKPTDPIAPQTRGWNAGKPQSANGVSKWFGRFYQDLGVTGASSHSGRRTAITRYAEAAVEQGISLRDVQALAGHVNFATTMIYVDPSETGKRKLVEALSAKI